MWDWKSVRLEGVGLEGVGLEDCRIGRVKDWKSANFEGCIGLCDFMDYIGSIFFDFFDAIQIVPCAAFAFFGV